MPTACMGDAMSDLIGKRFGKIVVISMDGKNDKGKMVTIRCDCGKSKQVYEHHVRQKRYASCGCARRKHGHVGSGNRSSTYIAWQSMKSRCLNPLSKGYDRYGGSGITVCERWINSFENFLEDMGTKPEGTSIDRINNSVGYEPSNCRWATPKVQMNNRTCNRNIEYHGVTKTLSQWAEELGVAKTTLFGRLLLSDMDAAVSYLKSNKYHPRPTRSKNVITKTAHGS